MIAKKNKLVVPSHIFIIFLTAFFTLIALSQAHAVLPQVAAGVGHTVGLKSDGTVVAVGDNSSGQLNVGSWTEIVQVAAGVSITFHEFFVAHNVGQKSEGTVVA